MTTLEYKPIIQRLLALFPTIAGDVDRQAAIFKELCNFAAKTVEQAIDEYVGQVKPDRYLLDLMQLKAICGRIDRQAAVREATQRNEIAAKEQKRGDHAHRESVSATAQMIADMSDDEVLEEWRKLVGQMPEGKPKDWSGGYTVSQIRGNLRFILHISELFQTA